MLDVTAAISSHNSDTVGAEPVPEIGLSCTMTLSAGSAIEGDASAESPVRRSNDMKTGHSRTSLSLRVLTLRPTEQWSQEGATAELRRRRRGDNQAQQTSGSGTSTRAAACLNPDWQTPTPPAHACG